VKKLLYGNTNTFFIEGSNGGLLVDTDMAGTLPLFFRSIKTAGIDIRDVSYVLASHYHPDHIGLVGELQQLGVTLLLVDIQQPAVHFADGIFARSRNLRYVPIDENKAMVISCAKSRGFLHSLGIEGEIILTPSHSEDSISLILDDGDCIVGDLEPLEYLDAYEQNPALERDWQSILRVHPKRILYAHANEKKIG